MAAAGGVFDEAPGDQSLQTELFSDKDKLKVEREDNITDHALETFRSHYSHCNESDITKDDIFDYVYGVLHAPDFRAAFPNALSKEMGRIPMAEDFQAFAKAGRELGDLHVGYESVPEYPLQIRSTVSDVLESRHFRLGTKKMKFSGRRGQEDKSVLVINPHVQLTGIPDEAHDYVVNGRTPIEWFMDRYHIRTDKKSGIVNNPNHWFKEPEDLVSAIRRIVHVSVETQRIVNALPPSLRVAT